MNNLSKNAFKKSIFWISWLAFVALCGDLIINLPVKPVFPSIVFDDGFVSAMNHLPFSKYVPGKDYAMQYCPLGLIFHCENIGINKLLATLFFLFEHLCAWWVIWIYKKNFSPGRFILFACCLLSSRFVVHGDPCTPAGCEYTPLIVLPMLLSVSLIKKGKALVVSAILSGAYTALLTLTKFDVALEAIITLVAYVAFSYLFRYAYPKIALRALIAALIVSFTLICILVFHGPSNFFIWFANSLEMATACASGWNEDCHTTLFLDSGRLPLLFYLLFVALTIRHKKLGFLGMVLLPSVMLSFRHGFVVFDIWHLTSFLKYLAVVLAFLSIFLTYKKTAVLIFVPLFVCVALMAQVQDYVASHGWTQPLDTPSKLDSMELSETFLPKSIRRGKIFDSVPSCLANWCYANNLEYKPNPCIMLCQACSNKFDQMMSQYYLSSTAPDYLLCEFMASFICRRHMFFETPQAWRTIINAYQILSIDKSKQFLLLEKNKTIVLPCLSILGDFKCTPDQWYDVPVSQNPIYCSFDFKRTLVGKVSELIYKLPAFHLMVQYDDNRTDCFKLVTDVAQEGVLINYLPQDMDDLIDFFKCRSQHRVKQFKLIGLTSRDYGIPISAHWLKQTDRTIQTEPPGKITSSDFASASSSDAKKEKYIISLLTFFSYFASPYSTTNSEQKVADHYVFDRSNVRAIAIEFKASPEDKTRRIGTLLAQLDDQPPKKVASEVLYRWAGLITTRENLASGYRLTVDTARLAPGPHKIALFARSDPGGKFTRIDKEIAFKIR